MYRLLLDLKRFEASNPRDYVYGIYGLSRKLRPDLVLPDPDYECSFVNMLADATWTVLKEKNSLDYFNMQDSGDNVTYQGRQCHPSWFLKLHQRYDRDRDASRLQHHTWNAAGCLVAQPVPGSSPGTLMLEGLSISPVAQIFKTITRNTRPEAVLIMLEAVQTVLAGFDFGPTACLEMLATTLTAATDFQRGPLPVHSAVNGYNAWRVYVETHDEWPPRPHELPVASSSQTHRQSAASEYHIAFIDVSANRSVFVIASGHLGIGPQTMRSGDTVAVLYGCRWPVVLRRLENRETCEFLGIAYIYGLMQGEALELEKQHDTIKKEQFSLV